MALNRLETVAMVAMALGIFMDGLDSSIINIAVPAIAETFGTDTTAVAWVTIVYFIMIAGLMLSFGRIADTGHIKMVYIAGFAVFSLGSLMCGLSWSLEFLILSRVVQGAGAAMIAAVAPMFCVKYLPASKLGFGMAILMVGSSLGFGIGPAVGGLIIEVASWHWAFFINIPIGIIGILIALKGLPKDVIEGKPKLDIPGTCVMFIAVLCGVLALELFSYPGYGTACIGLAVVMLILLFAFVRIEKKVGHPMLNIGMFRDWRFVSLLSCYMIISLAFMGIFYILPFYLTKSIGLDSLSAGLVLLSPNIISGLITIPVGRYCDRNGRRGMALFCSAVMVAVSVLYAVADPAHGWIGIMPAVLAGGLLWGIIGPSVCSRAIDIAHDDDKAMASAINSFVYYVGGSIGTALFASLITFGAGSAGIPVEDMPIDMFMDGYYFTMVCAIAISLLGVLTAWIVNEKKIGRA